MADKKRFIVQHKADHCCLSYSVVDTAEGVMDWSEEYPEYAIGTGNEIWNEKVCETFNLLWAERVANALNLANEKAEVYPPL